MAIKSIVSISLIVSIILGISAVSFASYGKEHIYQGSLSNWNVNGTTVSYWRDSSVGESGSYYESVINAIRHWGNSSSKLTLTRHVTLQSSTNIQIYVSSSGQPNVAGQTNFYNRTSTGGYTIVPWTDVRDGSSYDFSAVWIFSNTVDSWTQSYKNHNTGHEIGHALGMNHFENSPSHWFGHWMKSGKLSIDEPTTTDIEHMQQKYGN